MTPTAATRRIVRSRKLAEQLLSQFDWKETEERTGLIFADGAGDAKYVELPNRHVDPKNNFRLTSADVRAAEKREGAKFLAIFHTHLMKHLPQPSKADYAGLRDGDIGVVYHAFTRRLVVYGSGGIIVAVKLTK